MTTPLKGNQGRPLVRTEVGYLVLKKDNQYGVFTRCRDDPNERKAFYGFKLFTQKNKNEILKKTGYPDPIEKIHSFYDSRIKDGELLIQGWNMENITSTTQQSKDDSINHEVSSSPVSIETVDDPAPENCNFSDFESDERAKAMKVEFDNEILETCSEIPPFSDQSEFSFSLERHQNIFFQSNIEGELGKENYQDLIGEGLKDISFINFKDESIRLTEFYS